MRPPQACFEGNFKVVEVLLEEGTNKGVKNRWGQTPLREAILNRYRPQYCDMSAEVGFSLLLMLVRILYTQAGPSGGVIDAMESPARFGTGDGRAL